MVLRVAAVQRAPADARMVGRLAGVIAEMESYEDLKQLSMGSERFERPAVWVEMYDTALKEQARVAKACVDAGIDERRTRVIERHGKELDGVLRKVLDAMMRGLTARGMPADELAEFWRAEVPGIVRGALVGLLAPPAALGPAEEVA
ncbi:MAG TPA: hypothetical protein VNT52_15540 [Acidimicrobiales bacterium]|nr:hypothetical protein [Acidimicrobiales bacterium]